jgi:tRNA threonylcarbamoyladenosine biosynthesis protein TsaE
LQLTLESPAETEALGAALWSALPEKYWVYLYGELGAGKTTLIRGLLRAAGYTQVVKSPTYSLVEEYEVGGRRVFHFDLYRLKDPEELAWLGMEDYLQQTALCFIEWPQMGAGYLPAADIVINLQHHADKRLIEIKALQASVNKSIKLLWKNKEILL